MTAALFTPAPPRFEARVAGLPILNFWIFGAPFLGSIVYFFVMLADDSRIWAPALPILCVVAAAIVAMILDRNPCQFNADVVWMVLAYCTLCLVSILIGQDMDSFAIRKLGLPLVGMAPAMFRFYVTPRQLWVFLIALFAVAYIYTTETSYLAADGFFSTDSPYESIIGVTFGAITVWLVASGQWSLAAFAYAACVLFFKRNAIVAAPLVASLIVVIQLIRPNDTPRALRWIALVAIPVLALFALYLNDLFDLAATSLFHGYNPEFLSVGRTPIYDAILYDFDRSTVTEQLLGHGTGSVERLVSGLHALNGNLQLAHDEYLSWLYDFGIVGLVILVFAFARIARGGVPTAAVLLFMASSMTGENYFLVSFNCLGVFILFSTNIVKRDGFVRTP